MISCTAGVNVGVVGAELTQTLTKTKVIQQDSKNLRAKLRLFYRDFYSVSDNHLSQMDKESWIMSIHIWVIVLELVTSCDSEQGRSTTCDSQLESVTTCESQSLNSLLTIIVINHEWSIILHLDRQMVWSRNNTRKLIKETSPTFKLDVDKVLGYTILQYIHYYIKENHSQRMAKTRTQNLQWDWYCSYGTEGGEGRRGGEWDEKDK